MNSTPCFTVQISTTQYFGARLHASMADAVAYALTRIRSSGCVIREKSTGRRFSIHEAQQIIRQNGSTK